MFAATSLGYGRIPTPSFFGFVDQALAAIRIGYPVTLELLAVDRLADDHYRAVRLDLDTRAILVDDANRITGWGWEVFHF